MDTVPNHLTASALEQGLDHVLESPQDGGFLHGIVVRPGENERWALATAELSPAGGVKGDRWATDHWQKLPDGSPDPRSQVSLMNVRILKLIAGEEAAMCLAGDNLIVDLDVSEKNLPVGSRLRIGAEVVLEMTDQPHTGCWKFSHRFGQQARDFINGAQTSDLNLRGRYARIVTGGTINVGDAAEKTQEE